MEQLIGCVWELRQPQSLCLCPNFPFVPWLWCRKQAAVFTRLTDQSAASILSPDLSTTTRGPRANQEPPPPPPPPSLSSVVLMKAKD